MGDEGGVNVEEKEVNVEEEGDKEVMEDKEEKKDENEKNLSTKDDEEDKKEIELTVLNQVDEEPKTDIVLDVAEERDEDRDSVAPPPNLDFSLPSSKSKRLRKLRARRNSV